MTTEQLDAGNRLLKAHTKQLEVLERAKKAAREPVSDKRSVSHPAYQLIYGDAPLPEFAAVIDTTLKALFTVEKERLIQKFEAEFDAL